MEKGLTASPPLRLSPLFESWTMVVTSQPPPEDEQLGQWAAEMALVDLA